MSALYGAAGVAHDPELTRVLLEAGANPDDGESVYHSTEARSTDCLRLLLEHGAQTKDTNALAHALDGERLEHVRLLLEAGADPNEGALVAHAVRRGRGPEFIRLLAAHGADLDRPGGETWRGNVPLRTPYQHAVLRGRDDTAAVLAELGASTELDPATTLAVAALARGERPSAGAARRRWIPIRRRSSSWRRCAGTWRSSSTRSDRTSVVSWAARPWARCSTTPPGSGSAEVVTRLLERGANPDGGARLAGGEAPRLGGARLAAPAPRSRLRRGRRAPRSGGEHDRAELPRRRATGRSSRGSRSGYERYAAVVTASTLARCTSRKAPRCARRRPPRPRSPPRAPRGPASRARISRIWSVAWRCPFARSSQALSASPSTPNVSDGWRIQSIAEAIVRYWWMRRNVMGCESSAGPHGRARRDRLEPVGDPRRRVVRAARAAGRRRGPRPGPCGRPSAASSAGGRTGSRRRRGPARAGRGGRGRAGRAGSRRTCRRRRPRVPRNCRAIAARSTIPACAMISAGGEWRSSSRPSESAIGGRPRPPWMRIGTRRSAASANTGSRRGSSGRKRCARGCSLIPRAPRSRHRTASSMGDSVRSRRTNGHELVGRGRRVRERPVVRGAERRMPVGLVEAEDVRARDPVRALDRKQLVGVADHPVDVLAEMDVRVEDRRPGGELGARELGVLRQQAVRALDRVHALSLWRRGRAGHACGEVVLRAICLTKSEDRPTGQISEVRRFSRLVTQRVGALDEAFLGRDRSLGQSRVLWEIGDDGLDLRVVARAARPRLRLSDSDPPTPHCGRARDRPAERGRRASRTARLTVPGAASERSSTAARTRRRPRSSSRWPLPARRGSWTRWPHVERLLTASLVRLEPCDPEPSTRAVEPRLPTSPSSTTFDGGFDRDRGRPDEPAELRRRAGSSSSRRSTATRSAAACCDCTAREPGRSSTRS